MKPNSGPCLSILIYHRVLAGPDPLFPQQVHASQFERQLLLLKRFFTLLPLSVAVRRLRDGDLPPRAACITFDDGYADNADVALPLLQKHGLSACFFIASGYLDGGRMWNDSIIEALRNAPGDKLDLSGYGLGSLAIGKPAQRRAAIDTILGSLKYRPFSQRQAIAAELHGRIGPPEQTPLMMRSQQVIALHRAGMEIGAHTVSHPILAALSDRAARADIANGKRQLEDLLQATVSLFAYPNGKVRQDYGPAHVAIVKSLGFDAAVATDRGAARPGCDVFQLPRFTPWECSRLGFLLRLAQNRRRATP